MFSIYLFSFIILTAPNSVLNISYTPSSQSGIQANTNTINNQSCPSLAVLDNGGFVLAWETQQNTYDITGQIFDSGFKKSGSEIPALKTLTGDQRKPYVLNLRNKNKIVFLWNDITADNVTFRIFDYNQNPLTEEITVSSTHSQPNSPRNIKASSNSNGDFLITWQVATASTIFDVWGRFVGSDGSFLSEEFLINSNTNNSQEQAFTCSLTNNNFVVVFQSNQTGSSSYDFLEIYYKIYSSKGDKSVIKDEAIANFYTSGAQGSPVCTGLMNGGFVIAFHSTYWGQFFDVAYRIFDNIGNSVSNTDIKINTGASFINSITSLLTGGFAIVCGDLNLAAYYSFKVFAFDGTLVVPEIQEFPYTIPNYLSMSSFNDGRLIISWHSNNGSDDDVYYKVYNFTGDCYSFKNYLGYSNLSFKMWFISLLLVYLL
jgi:hypothetical protein